MRNVLLALVFLVPAGSALGHGEAAESVEEFHLHLDDYRSEIDAFIAEIDPIVDAYRAGDAVQAGIDGLIGRWERIAVHGAIETHATVIYPTIWQRIIGFQQATLEKQAADAVAAAGDDLAAALWQGLGALRLAAAGVESGTAHAGGGDDDHAAAGAGEALSGPESIDRIVAELEQAVAAYADGDCEAAQALIHDAYMQRFEYLEGDLIARDADLVSRLEKDFNATLPLLIQRGAPAEELRAAFETVKDELARARGLLAESEADRAEVF